MTPSLKFKTQSCILASMLVASCANNPFLPRGSKAINARCLNDKCHENLRSISDVYKATSTIISLRGGGDRDYGYSNDRYYDDDDHNRGYGSQGEEGAGRYDGHENDRYGREDGGKGYGDYGDYGSERRERFDDDYYGDDRDRSYAPLRGPSIPLKERMPDVGGILRNGNKKVGMMFLGGGAVFTLLGVSLFFNKTLMRLGNLLFIFGVPLFIGPGRTAGYFLQPKKARATGCLGFGIFLVMVGWPIFGIALEVFGILNLFGNMFPVFMVLLKQMPVIGPMLQGNGGGGRAKSARKKNTYKDSYRYDDEEEKHEGNDRYADQYY